MDSMNLLRDMILVEPDPARDDITAAGIVVQAREGIHTSDEQLGRKGTVILCGPDVDQDQLRPGHRILFGEFNYPEHRTGGKRYLLLQDKDVCGVIDG